MKKYGGNRKNHEEKYEEIIRKYEGKMKKYVENIKKEEEGI